MEGRTGSAAIGLLVLAIGLFHAMTLREGHAWVGDDIQYVLHAQNLIEGLPYADFGYVYNPDGRIPPSYPPVYPMAIAPLIAAFGDGFVGLKLLSIVFFAASLLLLAELARDDLPFIGRAGLVAILGINPVLWNFKDYALSESLFTMICLGCLVVDRLRRKAGPSQYAIWLDGAIGVLAYLAYGTRAVGALVLAAVVIASLWRERKLTRAAWLPVAVFVPLALVQNLSLHSEASHAAYKLAALSPALVLSNLAVVYPQLLASFFEPGMGTIVMLLIGLATLCLAAIGWVSACRMRGPRAAELLLLGYGGFFLLISHHDVEPIQRYLIPLFPLYCLYLMIGLHRIAVRAGARGPVFVGPAYLALFMACLLGLAQLPADPFVRGADGASARALYDFVRAHTERDDVLVFFEPRALIFYTGRPSTQFTAGASAPEHAAFLREVDAAYWVDTGQLPGFLGRRPRPVFDNGEFQVYPVDALFPALRAGS